MRRGISLEQQGQLLMQPYASDCHEVVTSAKTKEISKGRWGRGGASDNKIRITERRK